MVYHKARVVYTQNRGDGQSHSQAMHVLHIWPLAAPNQRTNRPRPSCAHHQCNRIRIGRCWTRCWFEGPAEAGSGADADGDAESDIGRAIAAGDAETSGATAGMERSNEIQFTDETKRLSRQTD